MAHELGPPERPLTGGVFFEWDPGDAGWWRLYHGDYRTPDPREGRSYGPVARFDHHTPDPSGAPREDPDGRSVIYLGAERVTSAHEVLWDQPPDLADSPTGPRIARVCHRYRLAQLRPTAPVRLLRLDDGYPDEIGALPELATGPSSKYPLTQEWARAIYEDLGAHGIYYPSSHDQQPCIAVWDNAPDLEFVQDAGTPRDASVHEVGVWEPLLVEYTSNKKRNLVKIEAFECQICGGLGLP